MDRAAVIGLITTTYQAILPDISLPEGEGAFFNGVLNNALRLMGVGEDDLETYTIDPTKVVDVLALTDYYATEGFLRKLVTAVDIQAYTPAVAKKRSQMFAQMQALRDDAANRCAQLGYPVFTSAGSNTFEAVRWTLDYLEPDYGGF